MDTVLVVNGMYGMGDNIFQRPFIRAALARYARVWLRTPWPELYRDMERLFFLEPTTKLRTQSKNIARNEKSWSAPPRTGRVQEVQIRYGSELNRASIIQCMERILPLGQTPFQFDLPDFTQENMIRFDRPLAVVRPATVRTEWVNSARNPDPKYLQQAVDVLKSRGFTVISVADVERGKEDYVNGPLQNCDQYWDHGDLRIGALMALIQTADLVVGGVGWIVPACIAAGTPLFVVQGGQGQHNDKPKITDQRMDLSRVGWARPDNYCLCRHMRHNCDKTITNFDDIFRRWLNGQGFQ